jgi:predicted MFS family arabinose efflux permease
VAQAAGRLSPVGGTMRRSKADGSLHADALGTRERVVIYAVLLLSSLAYNVSFILVDYIRPFLVRDLHMPLTDTALLYSAQGAGVLVGSFVQPLCVGRWGSRSVVCGSAAAVAALTVLGLGATDFTSWALSRFGIGFMLAGCYVSATTMLANFFPPRVRGRLVAANMSMFSVALLAAGSVGALAGESGWRTLLFVSVALSGITALLAGLLLPDDRQFVVYANHQEATASNVTQGRWSEMFTRRRIRLTLGCLLLAGLNFSGYEFYSGFITTYLLTVRHFDASVTASFVIIDGLGTLAGSLLWGWVADRYGRRLNAPAFGAGAFFIVAFLVAPRERSLLYVLEAGYALCLSATNCWGSYFAELFPIRLRPMGTSLFHGGHLVSLFAPFLVAFIARAHALALGMALAPATFMVAAMLWWMLPETLTSSAGYRGFDAESAQTVS